MYTRVDKRLIYIRNLTKGVCVHGRSQEMYVYVRGDKDVSIRGN